MKLIIKIFILSIYFEAFFSSNLKSIFQCNFDDGNNFNQVCGGSTGTSLPNIPNPNSPSFQILRSDSIPNNTNPSWFVSDFTSISQSVADLSDKCKIPFQINVINYYFCQPNNNVLECKTNNGETKSCTPGNFLRAKSANSGAAFTSTFTVRNPLELSKPGRSKITLYTYIHCYNSQCEASNEFITIKIAEDETINYKEIFKIGFENIRDKEWVYNEADFTTKNDTFRLRIELSRTRTIQNSQAFVAIDEINIFEYEDDAETITTGLSNSVITNEVNTQPVETYIVNTSISTTSLTISTAQISNRETIQSTTLSISAHTPTSFTTTTPIISTAKRFSFNTLVISIVCALIVGSMLTILIGVAIFFARYKLKNKHLAKYKYFKKRSQDKNKGDIEMPNKNDPIEEIPHYIE